MKELRKSTAKGQEIINKATSDIGFYLLDVYNDFSTAKDRAWKWCWEQFEATEEATDFHICSANTFGFTCAWYGMKDGENILRFETKDNSYLVWLDR